MRNIARLLKMACAHDLKAIRLRYKAELMDLRAKAVGVKAQESGRE